ncbi:hypothetical protein [Anaerovibrio sp. RM50]|uniref:hypothetical protein n=1 Tax=Anaerovibrio sp. RM50 TaxID=1200557 RepID=UPI00048788D6|nr:hypothetical protein [Anaerovibrio sp. RM50]
MLKKHIVAGMASLLLCSGMTIGSPAAADAATTVNLDRNDVAYHQEMESQSKKWDFQYEPQEGIKVGYIITGDYEALLDDETMGYIRRVLHTKFPGSRYPVERIESIGGHIHQGRRNTGDTYILSEAHDVLALEFEKLEDMYKRVPRKVITRDSTIERHGDGVSLGYTWSRSESDANASASGGSGGASANGDGSSKVYGFNGGLGFGSSEDNIKSEFVVDYDTLGADNSYDFTPHLTTLPKDDYVRFVRELEDEGLGGYDYLIMFNIKPLKSIKKYKVFGATRQSDFRLSVRAIDVATGKYIDRGEYLSRGTSSSFNIHLPIIGDIGTGPSWRRAMRKSLLNAMIESFNHMPIGKYSICDNPYCARRQDEIRMEKVFGRNNRHCVKHCNDRTFCGDHMVSYEFDADLPARYVKGQKDELYIRD